MSNPQTVTRKNGRLQPHVNGRFVAYDEKALLNHIVSIRVNDDIMEHIRRHGGTEHVRKLLDDDFKSNKN